MKTPSLLFDVPPGIGDVSWVYSKVRDLALKEPVGFRICCDPPNRSEPFVQLLPGVVNFNYSGHYAQMLPRLLPYDTDLAQLPPGQYALSMNPHLEAGRRLDQAFPKQTTHYHYPLNLPSSAAASAQTFFSQVTGVQKLGFYCSSYKHRPDLGFWTPQEWVRFLTMISHWLPKASFIALGAEYDDKTQDVVKLLKAAKVRVHSAIGSEIGCTISIMQRLDYFFAFPSGLAILADVLDLPCMMWYWSNVPGFEAFKNFPNSYADPDNIRTFRHINAPYHKVEEALKLFQLRGLPWIPISSAQVGPSF